MRSKLQMYRPNFPNDFPSSGIWDITYFDEYEEAHPLRTERVLLIEKGYSFSMMRKRTKHGWDFLEGEKDKRLIRSLWRAGSEPYITGQWRMYTMNSVIHLVSARCI